MIIQSVDQVPGAIQAQISANAIAEIQTSDQAVRAQISAEAIASIQSVDQVPQAIRMQISVEAMADIQSIDQVPDTLLTQIRARAVEEERIRVTQELNQLSLKILPKLEKEAVENYRVEQMTRTYNSLELANDRREMCETLEQSASAIEWEKYALGVEWDAEWEDLTNPQRIEKERAAGKRDFMVATEGRSQGLWSNLRETTSTGPLLRDCDNKKSAFGRSMAVKQSLASLYVQQKKTSPINWDRSRIGTRRLYFVSGLKTLTTYPQVCSTRVSKD